MRKNLVIFLTILGFVALFSCKKDETQALLSTNPGKPVLTANASYVLDKNTPAKVITFTGTLADFGYKASVEYTLEVDLAGNSFKKAVEVGKSVNDTFKIATADLNTILLTFEPDVVLNVGYELRVKAKIYGYTTTIYSDKVSTKFSLWDSPKLILSTTAKQKLASGIKDGVSDGLYKGWIYLSAAEAAAGFKLTDGTTAKIYGQTANVITENGSPIVVPEEGSYNVEVDMTAKTIAFTDNTLGLIGSATSGIGGVSDGWSRDIKMTWNFTDKTWNIKATLVDGMIKFRTHGMWSSSNGNYNLGTSLDALVNAGNSSDLPVTAGTYNIKVDLAAMKATMTPATK